jgi:hypothetical protein
VRGPIVLEGPDGAGKSTLAVGLSPHPVRNGPPFPGSTCAYLRALYTSQLIANVVIDRSWPSEMIYGPRVRGHSLLGSADAAALVYTLTEAKGVMVLCLPPFEVCRAAWRSRPELLVDEAALLDVWNAYRFLADVAPPSVIVYDWTQPLAEEMLMRRLG